MNKLHQQLNHWFISSFTNIHHGNKDIRIQSCEFYQKLQDSPINEFTFDDAFPGWTLRYFSSETNLQLHPSAEFWSFCHFSVAPAPICFNMFQPVLWEVCEGALMQEEFQMKPFDWFPEPKLSAFGSYIQAQRGSHWEKVSNLTPFGYIVYTSLYTKPKPLAKVLNLDIHQLIIWLVDIILRLGFYQKTLPLPPTEPAGHGVEELGFGCAAVSAVRREATWPGSWRCEDADGCR